MFSQNSNDDKDYKGETDVEFAQRTKLLAVSAPQEIALSVMLDQKNVGVSPKLTDSISAVSSEIFPYLDMVSAGSFALTSKACKKLLANYLNNDQGEAVLIHNALTQERLVLLANVSDEIEHHVDLELIKRTHVYVKKSTAGKIFSGLISLVPTSLIYKGVQQLKERPGMIATQVAQAASLFTQVDATCSKPSPYEFPYRPSATWQKKCLDSCGDYFYKLRNGYLCEQGDRAGHYVECEDAYYCDISASFCDTLNTSLGCSTTLCQNYLSACQDVDSSYANDHWMIAGGVLLTVAAISGAYCLWSYLSPCLDPSKEKILAERWGRSDFISNLSKEAKMLIRQLNVKENDSIGVVLERLCRMKSSYSTRNVEQVAFLRPHQNLKMNSAKQSCSFFKINRSITDKKQEDRKKDFVVLTIASPK